MADEDHRSKRLTDLELKVLRTLRLRHQQRWGHWRMSDEYLQDMSRTAVEALTTGSVSGRRREAAAEHRRFRDPGSHPDRIRALARRIEASFHTMPDGWVSADDVKEILGG